MLRVAIVAALAAGCDYTSFQDCAIACNAASGCPDGLACGREGLCRVSGTTASCSDLEDADPSCTCSDANTLSCKTGPTACALGCVDESAAPARCRHLVPSNDVGLDQLGDVDAPIAIAGGTATFDTDTGEITGAVTRAPGSGAVDGIGYASTAAIGVFTLHALTVATDGTILFKGTRAAAFVVETTATIDGFIDATGGCVTDRSCGGPGGGTGGGTVAATGCGPGGPGFHSTTTADDSGGGGGAGQTPGAAGGLGNAAAGGTAGAACLSAMVEPLAGGSGGGTGGEGDAATIPLGGGGGGALQITALDRITVSGTINAGGAGGGGGGAAVGTGSAAAGAGGGGGGAILLEAITVTITGVLAANGGGGGGGGNNAVAGGNGHAGGASATRAAGGAAGGAGGGAGGLGAASTRPPEIGDPGTTNGGGGGGGGGAIFVRASATPDTTGAVISPPHGTDQVHLN